MWFITDNTAIRLHNLSLHRLGKTQAAPASNDEAFYRLFELRSVLPRTP